MFFREGSEIKWLRSKAFLFWRAAGGENFALEAPNKPFSFDFEVGSRSVKPLRSVDDRTRAARTSILNPAQ